MGTNGGQWFELKGFTTNDDSLFIVKSGLNISVVY